MTFDPRRVQAIFLAALDQKTPTDRIAVLDRECENVGEVRRRVEALLIAHEKSDSMLDRPLIATGEQIGAIQHHTVDPANEAELPARGQQGQP